jgi:hypothetical protein
MAVEILLPGGIDQEEAVSGDDDRRSFSGEGLHRREGMPNGAGTCQHSVSVGGGQPASQGRLWTFSAGDPARQGRVGLPSFAVGAVF